MDRLDKLLVSKGLVDSRTVAQKLIQYGAVQVNIQGMWMTLDKPSTKYPSSINLRVQEVEELKFVSRAGIKLEGALKSLCAQQLLELEAPCAQGLNVLDIGQSTGGFTHCLLDQGAAKVVGVDVGHDQLALALREDDRVVCLEGINARNLEASRVLEYCSSGFDWVVMDVSFISQTLIIPQLAACLKACGLVISLVKPQFEVARNQVGKGGIVRGPELHQQVEAKIRTAYESNGFEVLSYFASVLEGADGNQEFFIVARLPSQA